MIEILPKTYRLHLNKYNLNDKSSYNKGLDIPALNQTLAAFCLYNKNLYNTGIFIINNIMSCYNFKDNIYLLKANLEDNQKLILDLINLHIPQFNQIQQDKKSKKQSKLDNLNNEINNSELEGNAEINNIKFNDESKKLKPFKDLQLYSTEIGKDIYYQILGDNFLLYITQHFSKHQATLQNLSCSDYELLPGRVRQSCIQDIIDNYSNFFKALKANKKDNKILNSSKGRPQRPSYLPKNSTKSIDLPWQDFGKDQKFIKAKNISYLTKDYQKEIKLSKEEIEAYNDFTLKNLLQVVKNKFKLNSDPVLIRIVAKNNKIIDNNLSKVKIEAVFNTEIKIDDNSLLGQVINDFKSQDNYKNKNKEIKNLLAKSNDDIIKIISNMDLTNTNKAGIDLGISNIASIAYSLDKNNNLNNSPKYNKLKRGRIISAKDYNKQINKINNKIDSLQSQLAHQLQNPLINELLQKRSKFEENYKANMLLYNEELNKNKSKDNLEKGNNLIPPVKEQLSKSDRYILKQYYNAIYEHPKYKKLLTYKNDYKHDYIHKLTTMIADNLASNEIDLVSIGKNIGWKSETKMGRKMNRQFLDIPHAKLINILRYKCYERGILLVTTEESYTSKTSFVNNSILKEFNDNIIEEKEIKKSENKLNNKEDNIKDIKTDSLTKIIFNHGGKRSTTNRHVYRNYKTSNKDNKKNIHADCNAAYNVIRKIDKDFEYNKDKHSIKCDVNKLSFWDKSQYGLAEASRTAKFN